MDETRESGLSALRRGRYSQIHARYFITVCTYRRQKVLCKKGIPDLIFDIFLGLEDQFSLVASVVMPDHLHCVIQLEKTDVSSAIKSFKGRSGIAINRLLGRTGSLWQHGFFDHKFRNDEDLGPILSYMWNNPKLSGTYFRCNRKDWVWFKSIVTKDVKYPVWLMEHPLGS